MGEVSLSRRGFHSLVVGVGAYAVSSGSAAGAAQPAPDEHPPLPWFDVRDFGAIGDGVADDTTAIQQTVTAAAGSSYGGIVMVPPGKYKISSRIQFPTAAVDLVGAGRWSTLFVCANSSAGLGFGNISSGDPGAGGSLTGGFQIMGGADVAMNIGECSNRTFYDIAIQGAVVGLELKQTQNTLFEELTIKNCAQTGLVLDYGAGANEFVGLRLYGNPTNLVIQNSSDGSSSITFNGRPTDNRFLGGGIENSTVVGVDHAAGLDNYFIGTGFHGSGTLMKVRHQQPEKGSWGSYNVHLLGCKFLGGCGVEHTASSTRIYLTDCTFQSTNPAFRLGNGSYVSLDRYSGPDSPQRFAMASGSSDPEEKLIRYEELHPRNFTGAAATSPAYRTWIGTNIHDATRSAKPLFELKTSGLIGWGSGSSDADVTMARSAARRLRINGVGAPVGDPVLLVSGGIGVGNSEVASSPGSVVRRIRVFDANGNPLGYVPVYNNIT